MKVVHLSLSPLAGAPVRIVHALRRHRVCDARLIDLNPRAYGPRTFPEDLWWDRDTEECRSLLADADILHLHHWMDSEYSPFGNLRRLAPRARMLRHFHSCLATVCHASGADPIEILNDALPKLVIPHHPERDFPLARVVPNLIPETDPLYRPCPVSHDPPVVFFSPTVPESFKESRWDTKGKPEVLRMLAPGLKRGRIRLDLVEGAPFPESMGRKAQSDMVIDDIATGSFHLTSLEALALGKPTLAYLDPRTIAVVSELTGSSQLPWVNVRLEDAAPVIDALAADEALRRQLGEASRRWIEDWYPESRMVGHYRDVYAELLEHGRLRQEPRLAAARVWLASGLNDLVWQTRTTRYDRELGNPGIVTTIAAFADLAGRSTRYNSAKLGLLTSRLPRALAASARSLVAGFTHNRNYWDAWLRSNRLERMDATRRDLFDPARCDFRLDRYQFACGHVKGLRVADIACGTGYGTELLRVGGDAASVVGVDLSSEAIAYSRSHHGRKGVRFLQGSAHNTGLPEASVDVVVSFETLEHLQDEPALLSEFHRLLAPGGVLMLSTPNDWGLESAPFHVRNYDARRLRKAVGDLFLIDALFNQSSGCMGRPENRGQPRGILPTTADNAADAECFILVARKSREPR